MDIFGGHHKIGLYLGVISMHLMVFSYSKGTEWVIFNFVAKMSNIYLECLKILIFFWVNCNSGNGPTYEEKKRVSPSISLRMHFKPI